MYQEKLLLENIWVHKLSVNNGYKILNSNLEYFGTSKVIVHNYREIIGLTFGLGCLQGKCDNL